MGCIIYCECKSSFFSGSKGCSTHGKKQKRCHPQRFLLCSINAILWGRSIWRNRRRTLITVSSIALGLAFAIFFIALAEGMYAVMIEQVVRMQAGHITLEHPEYREAPAFDLWLKDPSDLKSGDGSFYTYTVIAQ